MSRSLPMYNFSWEHSRKSGIGLPPADPNNTGSTPRYGLRVVEITSGLGISSLGMKRIGKRSARDRFNTALRGFL